MIDRTGISESGLFRLLCYTTAAVIVTLGFITTGLWHERDSVKRVIAGAANVIDFLKRELKMGCQTQLCLSNGGTLYQTRNFRNVQCQLEVQIAFELCLVYVYASLCAQA